MQCAGLPSLGLRKSEVTFVTLRAEPVLSVRGLLLPEEVSPRELIQRQEVAHLDEGRCGAHSPSWKNSQEDCRTVDIPLLPSNDDCSRATNA